MTACSTDFNPPEGVTIVTGTTTARPTTTTTAPRTATTARTTTTTPAPLPTFAQPPATTIIVIPPPVIAATTTWQPPQTTIAPPASTRTVTYAYEGNCGGIQVNAGGEAHDGGVNYYLHQSAPSGGYELTIKGIVNPGAEIRGILAATDVSNLHHGYIYMINPIISAGAVDASINIGVPGANLAGIVACQSF